MKWENICTAFVFNYVFFFLVKERISLACLRGPYVITEHLPSVTECATRAGSQWHSQEECQTHGIPGI